MDSARRDEFLRSTLGDLFTHNFVLQCLQLIISPGFSLLRATQIIATFNTCDFRDLRVLKKGCQTDVPKHL